MAYLTGKYGSVQRILPTEYDENGLPVWGERNNTDPIEQLRGYIWTPDSYSKQWTLKARPTPDGLAPASSLSYSNTVSAVRSWKLENQAQTQTYAASNTRGFNAKFAGVRSASGSFNGIGGFPPLNPGNRFLFRGFIGPESGSNLYQPDGVDPFGAGLDPGIIYADISGYVYQVAAIVTSVGITINYGSFAPIEWSVSFTSDWQQAGDELLALGIPTESLKDALGFFDQTDPPCNEALPSTKCMLSIAADKETAQLHPLSVCLESANLTFNTTTNSTTNSCSARAGGWQTSTVGTTDVQLQTTIHGSNYAVFHTPEVLAAAEAAIPTDGIRTRSRLHYPGIDRYVRIYIGNNDICSRNGAWEFNKMFVGSYTNLNVDISGGGIVSFATTMEFNAFPRDEETGACEKGYIKYRLPSNTRAAGDSVDWGPTDWETFVDLTES